LELFHAIGGSVIRYGPSGTKIGHADDPGSPETPQVARLQLHRFGTIDQVEGTREAAEIHLIHPSSGHRLAAFIAGLAERFWSLEAP
jgi:hypothetical protein